MHLSDHVKRARKSVLNCVVFEAIDSRIECFRSHEHIVLLFSFTMGTIDITSMPLDSGFHISISKPSINKSISTSKFCAIFEQIANKAKCSTFIHTILQPFELRKPLRLDSVHTSSIMLRKILPFHFWLTQPQCNVCPSN